MINKLQIFQINCVDPYRNIATEKYLLETVPEGTCILYLWQNQNTVVIGRNQNAWAECRTSLLEEEGGKLTRRLSGGGAVFHDLGNLNFTFLVNDEDYDLDKQFSVIQVACSYVGIEIERSGRNDLLAQGHKFSGNAFYHSQGKAYHHGTLLVNADMEKLGRYLTPSKAKLQAKGVASVRSRVINLTELVPSLTCQKLAECMAKAFGAVYGFETEEITLTPEANAYIDDWAERLHSWDWLYGPKLPLSLSCEARFDWGSLTLEFQVSGGQIAAVQVYSDSMDWELPQKIQSCLQNCRFNQNDMEKALVDALGDTQITQDICNLLKEQNL